MAVDKYSATINFLLGTDNDQNDSRPYNPGCDAIKNNPLFFNFLNAKEDNKQFVTMANDKVLNRTFIDGSVLKRFTFVIIDYRSVAYQAIVKQSGYPNENLEEFLDIQGIIDWITEQNDLKPVPNYPKFGDGCIIDSMRTTTENPNLNGVDTSVQPVLAKYSISIQIDYLDTTKVIWNN